MGAFEKILNNIKTENENTPNFDLWREYREGNTDMIIKNYKKNDSVKFNLCAIYGIGEGADIDVRILLSYFDKIDLFDCDQNALDKLLLNYNFNATEISRINIQKFNFIATQEDYIKLSKSLFNKNITEKKFKKSIIKLGNQELCNQELYDYVNNKYDFTICSGVHTQLAYAGIEEDNIKEHFIIQNYNKLIHYYLQKASVMMNDLIYSSLNENGVMYIGLDLFELSPNTLGIKYFDVKNKIIDLTKENDTEGVTLELSKLPQVSGALESFKNIAENYKFIMATAMWPFNSFKQYFMYCIFVQKNKM
jgi:hypothetical protein